MASAVGVLLGVAVSSGMSADSDGRVARGVTVSVGWAGDSVGGWASVGVGSAAAAVDSALAGATVAAVSSPPESPQADSNRANRMVKQR